ncbi:MAG: hypothetical protein AAF799_23990 [Myxococcota bacterium]
MKLLEIPTARALLGALFVLPLCIHASPSLADDDRPFAQFRDFTISQKTLLDFTHNGREVIITTNVITRADGTTVQDASDADAFQAFQAIFGMLNSTLGFPIAPADALSASATADTLVTNATANDDKTLEIRVGQNFAGTQFAEVKAKNSPTDRSVILLNLRKINILLECLEEITEVRDANGTVSQPDAGVLKVVRLTLLIHIISRLLVQADSNLEVATVNGQEVVRPRAGLNAVSSNHPDPTPRSSNSPITPQASDLTPPLQSANAVVSEVLAGKGMALSQLVTSYLQRNATDPEGNNGEVFDFEVRSDAGRNEVVTVRLHELVNKKTRAERIEDEELERRFKEFQESQQDEGGCAQGALFDAGVIETISVLPTPTPDGSPTPGDDPGSDTDGDTDFDDDTDTDFDTTGEFEDTDTDDDDEGSEGTDGDQPTRVPCAPGLATFSGEFVPQAGIDIDFMAPDCVTVSGPPPMDQLVIDDFGGGMFGGSGSGVIVVSLSEGSFVNDPAGFFLISELPTGTPIEIVLENAEGMQVTVTFTIMQGAGGMPSQLVDTQVSIGA